MRRAVGILVVSIGFSLSVLGVAAKNKPPPPCGYNGEIVPGGDGANSKDVHIFNLMAFGELQDLDEEVLRDGYIVSLEKRWPDDRASKANHHTPYLRRYEELTGPNAPPDRTARKRDKFLDNAFDDPKLQVVTHITRFQDRKSCGLYNGYGKTDLPLCSGGVERKETHFDVGMDMLEGGLLSDLRQRLADKEFTHIFFMSMGWHNDQRVSMCRYRLMTDLIEEELKDHIPDFKPMIIGMTWASSWFAASDSKVIESLGHIGSIINKAKDSDEAGALYGNVILNRVIPLANAQGLPVIVMGHSMGARLAGQSLFARALLKQGTVGPPADLAVFMQPAHSANRYVPGEGREGSPFDEVRNLSTRVVVTTTEKDGANPFAFWSPYLGGKNGLERAKRHTKAYDVRKVPENGRDLSNLSYARAPSGKVGLVDATFVGDHHDILDDQMGRFISLMIIDLETQN